MTDITRPLLSARFSDPANPDWSKIRFPVRVSGKLDGIRVRVDPKLGAVSRRHKPIPNQHLQKLFFRYWDDLKYLDGEIIVSDFNSTQSGVMSRDGEPVFAYYVFDWWGDPDLPFKKRFKIAKRAAAGLEGEMEVYPVAHHKAESVEDILRFEQMYLNLGYEGLMIRDPNGRYKFGRSTLNEGLLIKLKRFHDDEAVVVGFEELQRNTNELGADAFGLAKRSNHRAGMVSAGTLGSLLVEHPTFGRFSVGSGFDDVTRAKIWKKRKKYLGRTITFTCQLVGAKDKPRFPIFKGFRED